MFQIPFRGRMTATALACLVFAGCATYDRGAPAPLQTQPILIHFTKDPVSSPFGALPLNNSDVIVTGREGALSKTLVAGLGGLAGALASDAVGRHYNASAVGSAENLLQFKIDEELRADVEAQLANGTLSDKFSFGKGAGKTLDIQHAVIFNFADETRGSPFVQLHVALRDAAGNYLWETSYFASTGAERTLEAWGEQDGAPLKASISASLQEVVKVMLHDVASPYPRDDKSLKTVQAAVPFLGAHAQMVGYGLFEDDQYIGFVPNVVDEAWMSGVNILDKSVTVYRPAKRGDKTFLLTGKRARKAEPVVPLPAPTASAAAPETVAAASAPAAAKQE